MVGFYSRISAHGGGGLAPVSSQPAMARDLDDLAAYVWKLEQRIKALEALTQPPPAPEASAPPASQE